MTQKTTSLDAYLYDLPEECIAKYPLDDRSASKLLVYKDGNIQDEQFQNAHKILPGNSLIFFNNTKVISARMVFFKDTGARIEVFLTEAYRPNDIQVSLNATSSCEWLCMVGNIKRWKDDQPLRQELLINGVKVTVSAELVDRSTGQVKFTWDNAIDFSSIVEAIGTVPLPPYLNREAEAEDKERYQTVFSSLDGAVAAPTAGLHFTEEIMEALQSKHVIDYLTLHVSAGTFKPIKAKDFRDHPMHNEKVIVTKKNVENILRSTDDIFAVGTTALRSLESLYWFGVKLLESPTATFHIHQDEPYKDRENQNVSQASAMKAVLDHMTTLNLTELKGETEIFIYPGYQFRICTGLFTNFHQPGSTLILLVAAFIGPDWEEIYAHAIRSKYRFLSYGDTSLLYLKNN